MAKPMMRVDLAHDSIRDFLRNHMQLGSGGVSRFRKALADRVGPMSGQDFDDFVRQLYDDAEFQPLAIRCMLFEHATGPAEEWKPKLMRVLELDSWSFERAKEKLPAYETAYYSGRTNEEKD